MSYSVTFGVLPCAHTLFSTKPGHNSLFNFYSALTYTGHVNIIWTHKDFQPTLLNLSLEPKPKRREKPWESVAANIWPSGDHLQSNTAPCPWPSICNWPNSKINHYTYKISGKQLNTTDWFIEKTLDWQYIIILTVLKNRLIIVPALISHMVMYPSWPALTMIRWSVGLCSRTNTSSSWP